MRHPDNFRDFNSTSGEAFQETFGFLGTTGSVNSPLADEFPLAQKNVDLLEFGYDLVGDIPFLRHG
jgi:hypothetical protein